jgi:signal peptidase I
VVVVGFLVLLAARAWVVEPFAIPTGSMAPTLEAGDHVLGNKLAYFTGDPSRGDLAVFEDGDGGFLVKRVVASEGQVVEIRDGILHVDGRAQREPYVDRSRVDGFFFGPEEVPRGRFFVLGDQRGDSVDSRDFGAVASERFTARVDLRVWPLDRLASP